MNSDKMVRIQEVEVLNGFRVRLQFTDSSIREVDLEPYFHGPIFDMLRNDKSLFLSVKLDKRMGTIFWDNGADMDPDVLYHGLKPAWMESDNQPEVA